MRTIRTEHGLIACALLALSACGDGDGITAPTTGSAQVTIATTGRVLDRNGYTVSVDGHADVPVSANNTLMLPGLEPGPHTVRFGGVAENCVVAGGTTRAVEVVAGQQTEVQFSVQCTGNRFAYVETVNNVSSIYIRRLDGTGLTRIATGTVSTRVDWSPDGHRLVFAAPGTVPASRNLHIFDVDSGTTRMVPLPDIPFAVHPAWSPDGTRLVFSGIPADGVRTIYTVRTDGTDIQRLTPDPAGETMPAWSPDGTRIAYRRDTPTTEELWVMRADGSNPQRLATLGSAAYTQIDWSPDGSRIVFNGFRDGNWEIITIRPDGSGETRLTTTPAIDERYATFLPDGRIGYNAMPAGTIPAQDAWIMNAAPVPFTSTPGVSESVPAWQ